MKNDGRFDHRKANRAGFLLVVAVALSFASAQSYAQEQPLRVLILHAYNCSLSAVEFVSESITGRFIERSPKRIEVDENFFDLARSPGHVRAPRTATFLHDQYWGRPFDLVLSTGLAAVPLVIDDLDRWGLKRNDPSAGAGVSNEPGLWDQHRSLISAAAMVIALQSFLLTALLIQRRRRRKAERSLTESEDRMTFIATSMNVGLWQFNQATDEFWATEHTRAMFGIANDARLTHETFLAAIHHDDREIAFSALRSTLNDKTPATDIRVVAPDGQMRWVRIRTRSFSDATGLPDQSTGVFVDITAQKAADSEAELHRQEVTHLMRVSVLGELSGAIAHEVNQPLTAILLNAQAALYLLEQKPPNFAEVRDALNDIVKEDNRAGSVVRKLRGLLRKGEARFELVDLNEIVGSTTALLRNELINRRVAVETDFAAGLPTTLGDSVQLQQVLLNLMINAMDSMALMPETHRRIHIHTQETAVGNVEVLVKDHGSGIKEADPEQLFAPFHTTKEHGLGLGLTISSTIMRKHRGTIDLQNDETGGVTARISLPAQIMMMAAQ